MAGYCQFRFDGTAWIKSPFCEAPYTDCAAPEPLVAALRAERGEGFMDDDVIVVLCDVGGPTPLSKTLWFYRKDETGSMKVEIYEYTPGASNRVVRVDPETGQRLTREYGRELPALTGVVK